MNYKHTALLLCLFFIAGFKAYSQGVACPPNIDFELGGTGYWNYYTGSCCPIVTPFPGPAITGRHTLTSGAAVDLYGGFPTVSPGGGLYSLKLGNSSVGAQAEKATYYVHVPATISNYSLVYRYAVVFQDPSHSLLQQPRFEVTASDSVTGTPIPCAQFTHVSAPGLPGFQVSAIDPFVYYKSWATGTLNLSGLAGSTIVVEFATGDCSLGGHFGYGYLDMSCGLFASTTAVCDTDSVTVTAPIGFHAYAWYDSAFTTFLDTSRILTLPSPPTTTTYAVVLSPYPGFGCADTMYTTVIPSHLDLVAMRDTILCSASTVELNPHATDVSALTYTWSPPVGLGCTTCDSVYATPLVSTQYIVTVTNVSGCSISDTVNVGVSMHMAGIADVAYCDNTSATLATSVTGPYSPFAYSWSPALGLSCSTCSSTVATNAYTTSYIVAVTDTIGCTIFDTVVVRRGHIALVPLRDTFLCSGAGIMLNPRASDTGNISPIAHMWTSTTSIPCTTCDSFFFTPAASGQYVVTVTNTFGCTTADTVNITLSNIVVSTTDASLCTNIPVTITSSATGAFPPLTYSWSPATGLSCVTCTSPVSANSVSTNYSLTVTDSVGCVVVSTAAILRGEIMLSPMRDTFFCGGDNVTLVSGLIGPAYPTIYSWAPGTGLSCADCAAPVASPMATTIYVLTMTNSLGCTAKDTVLVAPDYYSLIMPGDTIVCVGVEVPLVISTTASSPTTQAWTPVHGLSNATDKSVMANADETIVYKVVVADSLGCVHRDSIKVERNILQIFPVQDTVICEMEELALARAATIDAYPVRYVWSPATDLSCPICEVPVANPKQSTTYVVVATDEIGCRVVDSVVVDVEMCDIWFPNAFTPNGDGRNDIARVIGHLRFYKDFSMNIYNRFGETVFTTSDILAGWDGVYNGVKQDVGVFFYKIQYSLNGKKSLMKGDITLVR